MTSPAPSPSAVQRWTLAVVCIATAMLMLDIAVVNTALSKIADDLSTGLSGLQWVVDAYTLALASVVLTAGSLADRFGRRRLFTVGLGLFTVASLLCGVANDIAVLNAFRALQGVGGAIMFAVSLALLANAFPDAKERAGALAAYGATIGASFAVGPLVGGALTSGLGWRWIFFVNIPLGLLCVWITRRYVAESKDSHARRVDVGGLLTLTGGLFLLILALLRGNEAGWGSAEIVAQFSGAAVLLGAFLAIEARVAEPMLPLKLFHNGSFSGAQIGAFAISATWFAVFFYITLYMQQILGLSAIEAGLVYLPSTIIMFFVAGATSAMQEKLSSKLMVVAGLLLVAIGLALMTFAQVDSAWTVALPGSIVAMIGTGLFNPSITAFALGSVPESQSGLAAGVNDTFRQAGIAVGVAALGALIPAGAAFGGGDPQTYVSGMHDALWVCAAVCLAGAIACFVVLRDLAAPAGEVADVAAETPEAVAVTA
ncbi:MFS transporter [Baekduia sp. Peel2402]|uniref:MFS transporter n=1 Tax=Baekduia sp. Peel2402 TaxID=3458296 RepID=UPI00403E5C8E